MKYLFFCSIIIISFFTLESCSDSASTNDSRDVIKPLGTVEDAIPDQYIVQLKNDVVGPPSLLKLDRSKNYSREEKGSLMEKLNKETEVKIKAWLANNGIFEEEVLHIYTAATIGAAVRISSEKFEKLKTNQDIETLSYDRMISIPNYQVESIERSGGLRMQTTPCGITNAGGFANANTSRWAWVVDSGIDLDHPDLNVVTNSLYAKSFVGGNADDCNGHGTHVAGTIAARNNSIGVVGVAAGAPVVPVKVFGCSGGSPSSTIISGINHVATYDSPGDVLNLSLGGAWNAGNCATTCNYFTSVTNIANSGTRVAIASGNNFGNAANVQPACINGTNIFTVTNMRCNGTYYDDINTGGNWGRPPVDFIATGTSVLSTFLNGGYATLTGTSMATPHVAGIMHVRNAAPLTNGTVTFSGVNYPIAVR